MRRAILCFLLAAAAGAQAAPASKARLDELMDLESMGEISTSLGGVFRTAVSNFQGLVPENVHAAADSLVRAFWDSSKVHEAARAYFSGRLEAAEVDRQIRMFRDPRFERVVLAFRRSPGQDEWPILLEIREELDAGTGSDVGERGRLLGGNPFLDSVKQVFKAQASRSFAGIHRVLNSRQAAPFRMSDPELDRLTGQNDARLAGIFDGNFLLALQVHQSRNLSPEDLAHYRRGVDSEGNLRFERIKLDFITAHLDAFLAALERLPPPQP